MDHDFYGLSLLNKAKGTPQFWNYFANLKLGVCVCVCVGGWSLKQLSAFMYITEMQTSFTAEVA